MAQAPTDSSSAETADPEETSPNMIVYRKVRIWSYTQKSLFYVVGSGKNPMPLLNSEVYFRLLGCVAERVFSKVGVSNYSI